MKKQEHISLMREKFNQIEKLLNEKARRRWVAVEAQAIGHGGIRLLSLATGMAISTIRRGIGELEDLSADDRVSQRKSGAGRKTIEDSQPDLLQALESLIDPETRGDPCSPLRWTIKSTKTLAAALVKKGYNVGATTVRRLLKKLGYSLQGNKKSKEGKDHPDRDDQFKHINSTVQEYQEANNPAISVDTKKKENLGNKKNGGKTYEPKGKPTKVDTHDFPDKNQEKAIPYGVFDLADNSAGVTVGIDHDTAEFAVRSIKRWWTKMGKMKYPNAKKLLVTADSGGSNSSRSRLWKFELQKLADELGLIIEVCHYPPGTSKWNKIEHKLFCHITRNWQGRPLDSLDTVVNLIGSTKTTKGLTVKSWVDKQSYEVGLKISDSDLAKCVIIPNSFHGEWNYEIHPRTKIAK
jgi:transposase